jgi:carbon-monoxide dehydrogenase catalytic subunit
METIHFKTVDPVSQELLRDASRKGIALNWERYEKQQPQDGFLRLGLCCPYGCMQGPCRIDPFGRGAQNGTEGDGVRRGGGSPPRFREIIET